MDDLILATVEDETIDELYALVATANTDAREAFGAEAKAWVGPGITVALWYPVPEGQAAGFTLGRSASPARVQQLTSWLRAHPTVVRVGTWTEISGEEEWSEDADDSAAT